MKPIPDNLAKVSISLQTFVLSKMQKLLSNNGYRKKFNSKTWRLAGKTFAI